MTRAGGPQSASNIASNFWWPHRQRKLLKDFARKYGWGCTCHKVPVILQARFRAASRRGNPFQAEFCSIVLIMDGQPRVPPPEFSDNKMVWP